MRIGIDIDDTLTDIKNEHLNALFSYSQSLGKEINKNINDIQDAYNDGRIYQDIFNITYEELKYYLGTILEEIWEHAKPRKFCVDILNKLHRDGNEIYIITARDSEFHLEPYLLSKNWLDKNSIYYDKLIVNARDKKKACLENKIDLLIDDSSSNCMNVVSGGIPAIRIGTNYEENEDFKTFDDWNQIYNFICENFNK